MEEVIPEKRFCDQGSLKNTGLDKINPAPSLEGLSELTQTVKLIYDSLQLRPCTSWKVVFFRTSTGNAAPDILKPTLKLVVRGGHIPGWYLGPAYSPPLTHLAPLSIVFTELSLGSKLLSSQDPVCVVYVVPASASEHICIHTFSNDNMYGVWDRDGVYVCSCVWDPPLRWTCDPVQNSHTHYTQETSSFAKPHHKCERMGGSLACQGFKWE